MKYELRDVSPVKRELDIEVPAATWREAVTGATRDLSRRIRLPGFRPGKVPSEIVRKMFGKEIESDVLEKLIPQLCEEALDEAKVEPLGRPVLQDKQLPDDSGRGLSFTVSFEVMPKVQIAGYKELALKRKEPKVTDADVDRSLEEMRERAARFTAVEGRPAAPGDYAVVDMQPEHGARQKSVFVAIKSGDEAQDLDRALVGKNAGDEFPLRMKTPRVGPPKPAHDHEHDEHDHEHDHAHDHAHDHEHDEEPAAEEAETNYAITVREVKARELPALDDDFAREVGSYENLAALREKVRQDLAKDAEASVRRDMVRQALDTILKDNPVTAPEIMVQREVQRMLEEVLSGLKRRGLPVERLRLDWERMAAEMRPDAERNVLLEIVFDAIAAAESIDVPADKVKDRIGQMAAGARRSPDAVRAQLEKDGQMQLLEASMRREASIDFVLHNARVTTEE